jgi:Cutinase
MTNANPPKKRRWVLGLVVLIGLALVVTVANGIRSGPIPPTVGQGPGQGATTTPGATVKPAGCPDVQVVFVPGTYETNPGADPAVPVGLLKAVADPLGKRFQDQPGRLSDYFTPYIAQFNNPTPYFTSEQDGVRVASAAIADTVKRCSGTSFALVGFSQGAASAGDLATSIGQGGGVIPPEKLLGVGLLSDPNRNPGTEHLIGPEVEGSGLAGFRATNFGAVGDRVVTFCAPGDLICATPAKATNLANLPATLALVGQYMQSGVHSAYASYKVESGQTTTQWLANWLGDKIEKAPKG